MDSGAEARLIERLRALPDAELAAMVGADRDLYEPVALRHAETEVDRRGGRSGLRLDPPATCDACGVADVPVRTTVYLPANTPDGVATFEARSCPACGRTALFLA